MIFSPSSSQVLLHHVHSGDDALAEEVLRSMETGVSVKCSLDILYEILQSPYKHVKTTHLSLHMSLRRLENEATENSQVYSDVRSIFDIQQQLQ